MARLFDADQVADCQTLILKLKVKTVFTMNQRVTTAIVVRMMLA